MRIAVVYTGFSNYMADCWRALSEREVEINGRGRERVELKAWIEDFQQGAVAFNPDGVMHGLDYWWSSSEKLKNHGNGLRDAVVREIAVWKPDVIFVCGWSKELPPHVTAAKGLMDIPMVLEVDMPWEWRVRKFVARFMLWKRLRRFSAVFVPGRSTASYVRWLGFRNEQIFRGKFGVNVADVGDRPKNEARVKERNGFLFVGRLSPEKGIRELAFAYKKYRECHSHYSAATSGIWPLDIYGMGSEAKWLEGVEGVTVHGFAQPDEIRAAYAKAGAFVIASNWDPWPLVILEACSAGLPIICTEHCWNRYELLRENGIVVKCGDVNAMVNGMLSAERGELNGWSGRELAAEYSCEKWADRALDICKAVIK